MRADDFRRVLRGMLSIAQSNGLSHFDVVARDLHRVVGGYPPKRDEHHAMPTCCDVMRSEMRKGDKALAETPSGRSTTLQIRYRLPREP
jgi:hypothetical protein